MSTYIYHTRQELPITIEKAWDFFSSPRNLALITPPALDFRIAAMPDSNEIFQGMIIDYTLKPLPGFTTRWKSMIDSVRKPYLFIDRQVLGPYKFWEHTHKFTETPKGVMVTDEVKYILPLGLLGRFAHLLTVRKRLQKIFEYRRTTLHKIFTPDEFND